MVIIGAARATNPPTSPAVLIVSAQVSTAWIAFAAAAAVEITAAAVLVLVLVLVVIIAIVNRSPCAGKGMGIAHIIPWSCIISRT